MLCPCQHHLQNIEKKAFEDCCQPIINNEKKALTAEELMRSRYSAYATKNAPYILKTYSKASATNQSLEDIQQWADNCQWVNLIIHSPSHDESNEVEFSAYYIENKQLCMIKEKSLFIKENRLNGNIDESHWVYHDGQILQNEVCENIKRNDLCFCQKGKKFKACCYPYL